MIILTYTYHSNVFIHNNHINSTLGLVFCRRPFQYVGSSSSISSGGQQQTRVNEPNSEDAQLYNRYRYYSRLRADVHPNEQALVRKDLFTSLLSI